MHGVIGLLWEASRTARIPGEDQNGFSKRAVEEARRTFFQAVDSIMFDQKTVKANFVLPGVKLEDDEDSEMQIYTADMKDGSIHDRRGNSVQNNGSLSMGDYESDFNSSESDHGGPVSLSRINPPNMNTHHPGALQNPIKIPIGIDRTQKHASTAIGSPMGVADGFSSREPQRASSSMGVFIKGEHSIGHSPSIAGQLNNLLPDKATSAEVFLDKADIIPYIAKLEMLLADLKINAAKEAFKSLTHFISVFNVKAGKVIVGSARPWSACFPSTTAQSGKRKRQVMEMNGQGKRDHGATISGSAARSPEQGVDLDDDSGELRVIPRVEFISSQSEQVPASPESSHEVSNDEQDVFRMDMLRCKTMNQLMNWINDIRWHSSGYFNTAIENVKEICKVKSLIDPLEPFPDFDVLQGALQLAEVNFCDAQYTVFWKEWQKSKRAGPSSTAVAKRESSCRYK